jgi:periplasmic divalent cation tolerance protein
LLDKEFLVVLSTCPSPAVATELAGALVEAGHAACVNIVPAVRSIYRWKGQVQSDDEALLVIKTTAGRFHGLREALLARHPYEVPEVVALRIADGHHPYLDWLADPDGSARTDES